MKLYLIIQCSLLVLLVPVLAEDYDYGTPLGDLTPEIDTTEEESRNELCMHCKCYQETEDSLFLDCSSLDLEKLPGWLNELLNLTDTLYVDLSYNAIEEIDSFPAVNAWNLDLSNNNLQVIKDSAFKSLSGSLLQLDLSSNKLDATGLQQNCFKGAAFNDTLAPFRVIDLSLADNQLHTVRADLFAHMTQLTDLNLSNNPLAPITTEMSRAISGIVTLQSLSLRSSGLEHLPDDLFSGLHQLLYIDLSGNRFKQVDPSLKLVPSLETLILDDNLIEVLDENSFSYLHNLRNLSISASHNLKSIEAATFGYLSNLNILRISGNKQLEWISPDAWPSNMDQPMTLQELDLSNNHLRYLPSMLLNDFQDWKNIDVINIQGNPWWCDCHNEWLITTLVPIIMQQTPQLTQNILCGGPAETALIKEEVAVIGQLTKPEDLPCMDKQFDPWQKSYSLPDPRNPRKEGQRGRKATLPLALTVVCVIVVMATFGMVGLLYLQKSRREGLRIRRVRHRGETGPGPRVGYTPASKRVPSGQPGLSRPSTPPANQERRAAEGGIYNMHFKDEEEGFDGPVSEEEVNADKKSHPLRQDEAMTDKKSHPLGPEESMASEKTNHPFGRPFQP